MLEKAKSSWIIYNLDKDLLTRAKSMIEKVEDMTFIISGLYKNQGSGIYHLKPNNNKEGSIVSLSKKYRSLFYDQRGYKRIPAEIFQSDFYTRQSFLMGYYAGDGARLLKKGVVIHNKGEIGTAGLYYLAKSLGYIVSISYSSIYRLQCCTTFRHKNITSIKSILPATPVPEIKKLQPDIIRNNTKIFFNEEEIVIYRGVRINCQRIPRQKLLDAIDRLINIMKKRHCSILEYYTDSKKIKYQTWCCNKQCLIGIKCVYLDTITYARICDCDKSTIVDDEYNNKEDEKEDDKIDYIYDIETENHHFAAGVGDLIVHNSMYGGYGVKKGYLPFMTGAMCVTAKGRQSIEKASKFLVENYGAKLIYGDSVTGDTPILVRYEDESIDILRIDEIGEVWKPYDEFKKEDSNRVEKQQTLPFMSDGVRFLNILEVWTGEKWSRVRRVIRHLTYKQMYRVITGTGCVDVTEDHSLLNKYKEKIKPTELEIGTELYHSFPPSEDFLEIEIKDALIEGKVTECQTCKQYKLYFEFEGKICKECCYEYYISETEYIRNPAKHLCNGLAYVWGIFFFKGISNKDKWELYEELPVLLLCKKILEECEPLFEWKIDGNKLIPVSNKCVFLINKWRRLFYDRDGYKKVPYFILNANDDMKYEFLNGETFFEIEGKIGAQGFYTLLHSLGFEISINAYDDLYVLDLSEHNSYSNCVHQIINLPHVDYNQYVYDIETESGRFLGGVGRIILKNTDSCYINFPEFKDKTNAKELDLFCRQVEEEVSSVFPKPMKFAYEEQIYWRYLILTKKRYMALKCDLDGNVDNKIAKRGVLLSRRDNSKFIRDVYSNLILKSFYKEDIDTVLYELYKDVKKICVHNVSVKDVVVTKSIGTLSDYKIRPLHIDDKKCKKRLEELQIYDCHANLDILRSIITAFGKKEDIEDKIQKHNLEYLIFKEYVKISLPAQVQLAERMRQRGSHVSAGERLGFIITQSGDKLSEKMEDVEYFKEHSETLRVDSLYYMKLMINPFDEVLMTVYKEKDIFKKFYKSREQFKKVMTQLENLSRPKLKFID